MASWHHLISKLLHLYFLNFQLKHFIVGSFRVSLFNDLGCPWDLGKRSGCFMIIRWLMNWIWILVSMFYHWKQQSNEKFISWILFVTLGTFNIYFNCSVFKSDKFSQWKITVPLPFVRFSTNQPSFGLLLNISAFWTNSFLIRSTLCTKMVVGPPKKVRNVIKSGYFLLISWKK